LYKIASGISITACTVSLLADRVGKNNWYIRKNE